MSKLEETFFDGDILRSESLNRMVSAINSLYDSYDALSQKAYPVKSEFGNSDKAAVSQKFFTDMIQNISSGAIDISEGLLVLDQYNLPEKCGWYILTLNSFPTYHMLVTSDDMNYTITQFLYGNPTIKDGTISGYLGDRTTILTRTYNINAPNIPDIPKGSWGKWEYNQKVITLNGGIIIE